MRRQLCDILAKNLASLCQCLEKISKVEFKDDRLICLLENISKQ